MRLDDFEQTTNDLKYMVMDEYCAWETFKENVKNCDGPTAKFCLACMLLNKKHDTIAINMKLLNGIFGGPDRIPASLQQALLVSGKAPAGTVLPAIQEQGMRFRADAKNATSGHLGQELFLSRWASTYFFYHEFVY